MWEGAESGIESVLYLMQISFIHEIQHDLVNVPSCEQFHIDCHNDIADVPLASLFSEYVKNYSLTSGIWTGINSLKNRHVFAALDSNEQVCELAMCLSI